MSEIVKANAPPKCLCGERHWSSQIELCGFYAKPAPAAPKSRPESVPKTGVETKALKPPKTKQASETSTKKGESLPPKRQAPKKTGRPRTKKAAQKCPPTP